MARRFRFDLRLAVAAVALFGLFIGLGNWQLQRAEYKRQLVEQRAARARLPAMAGLPARPVDISQLADKPVRLQGRYRPGLHVLLQNQINDGRAGMHVFTPFITDDGHHVLINRGWVRGTPGELPEQSLMTAAGTARGWLRGPPEAGFSFDSPAGLRDWRGEQVLAVPSLDLQAVARLIDAELYPMVVLLDPAAPAGYDRNWPPIPGSADRHMAYAAQWFLFAVITVVFFFLLSSRKTQ